MIVGIPSGVGSDALVDVGLTTAVVCHTGLYLYTIRFSYTGGAHGAWRRIGIYA
jgi:hypothetical protein